MPQTLPTGLTIPTEQEVLQQYTKEKLRAWALTHAPNFIIGEHYHLVDPPDRLRDPILDYGRSIYPQAWDFDYHGACLDVGFEQSDEGYLCIVVEGTWLADLMSEVWDIRWTHHSDLTTEEFVKILDNLS